MGIDIGGKGDELVGALAILLSAFLYAIGPMIVKRGSRRGPARPGCGLARDRGAAHDAVPTVTPARLDPSADTFASIAVLGLVCSALAFLLFFRLIAEIGPGRATVITYINPVVALALGVVILDESVTTGVVVGLLLILAGSWLSTDGRLPPGLAGLADRVRDVQCTIRRDAVGLCGVGCPGVTGRKLVVTTSWEGFG